MRTLSEVTRQLLVASRLPGVGSATLGTLMAVPRFGLADLDSLAHTPAPVERALSRPGELERALEKANVIIAAAADDGVAILSPLDDGYPGLLSSTGDRPAFLFVKGELAPVTARALCVIGTREPTRHGEVIGHRIACHYAERGWSIVSGLALGVDGIAHRGALAAGGHTVAVLAHGLDTVAPKSHTALAQEILAAGGALVSEYPHGVRPYGPNFVKRDRIQAGLAQAVVLIQTDLSGGSLHATRAALEYGRVVAYPVPTKMDVANAEPKIQGVLKIHEGARPEVAQYLKCRGEALSNLFAIRSKDDYGELESLLLEHAPSRKELLPFI